MVNAFQFPDAAMFQGIGLIVIALFVFLAILIYIIVVNIKLKKPAGEHIRLMKNAIKGSFPKL